ncbi:MAG: hypothetical protein LBD93_05975 [Treponema sp.]|jgi:hypothetical protein|nr:hypothetical protein [Treponema sp.]
MGTPAAGVNYIYCSIPSDGTVNFAYSTSAPTWNASRGGWYNESNRAIAIFYLNNGAYLGKRVLGDSSDDLIPTEVGHVTIGGTLVGSTSGTQKKEITLKKGFYRIELVGSKGGNSGTGNKPSLSGARGGYSNTVIYIPYTGTVTIFSTQKGDNGQDGNPGGNSIDIEVGMAPADDGLVKIYRVA